jgi:hypothetical protein
MKNLIIQCGAQSGLAASLLLTTSRAHAEGSTTLAAQTHVENEPEGKNASPGRYGMIIDLNLNGRAYPMFGAGPGVFLAAKLDRFFVGAGFDVFVPPSPTWLIARLELQWALWRTPDKQVELFGLGGYGWTSNVASAQRPYSSSEPAWGPARAGIGIRYWSSSFFGVYLNMGVDVSPFKYGDSEEGYSRDNVCFTPFGRLGLAFAITK